jgi:hypothetical protein
MATSNTSSDGNSGVLSTAPVQNLGLVSTVANPYPALKYELFEAQAKDYGGSAKDFLKIVFEVQGGTNKPKMQMKEIAKIKVLEDFLKNLIGVAIIRNLTVNISFTSKDQFAMVGLKGDSTSISSMADMSGLTSVKSFVCGNNLTGTVPVSLEETQAFSLQVKGTCMTANSAVLCVYAMNSHNLPFIITVQGDVERAGTNILQEHIPF